MTPEISLPPRPAGAELLITFLYYRDLPAAMKFYEEVLGFSLAIDQGFAKIYRVTGGGYLGLVDEAHGMHRAHPIKPVQICLRVPDVDAWYRYVKSKGVEPEIELQDATRLPIRIFTILDPEGYQIEIQTALDGVGGTAVDF